MDLRPEEVVRRERAVLEVVRHGVGRVRVAVRVAHALERDRRIVDAPPLRPDDWSVLAIPAVPAAPATAGTAAGGTARDIGAGVLGAAAAAVGLTKLSSYLLSPRATPLLQKPRKPRRLALTDWLYLSHDKRLQQAVPPYGLPLEDRSMRHILTLKKGNMYGYIPQWTTIYCGQSTAADRVVPTGRGVLWTQPLGDRRQLYVTYAHFADGRPVEAFRTWTQPEGEQAWSIVPGLPPVDWRKSEHRLRAQRARPEQTTASRPLAARAAAEGALQTAAMTPVPAPFLAAP